MRLAHISDLHLGYSSGTKKHPETHINLREQDGYDIFFKVIDEIIDNKVDAVLCTGDFFHVPAPSIYTLTKGQEGLSKLAEAGIPFYNLAGNHDATDSVKDIPANRVLHCPSLNLYSYIEPYIIKDIGENIVLHLVSHHGYVNQSETMKNVKPIEGKINILCTHGSCFNPLTNMVLHNEMSPREIIIPEDVLKLNWDYILMGHIHERGWVGSSDGVSDTMNLKQFYAGSLLRRGFADKKCPLGRGWTLWNINDKDNIYPEFFTIEQRPQYDKLINCNNKEVIDIENEIINFFESINLDSNPIVRINLVDLSSQNKSLINWKRLLDYTSKCLSFTTKVKTKDEIMKELEEVNMSFDLIKAYDDFWNETKDEFAEERQTDIIETSTAFLQEGRDKILSMEV